ncbi:Hypothetical protein, putative [Bodo saltans]|uniref:Uncharacterized protein n=1 Tax=Bodo saltans TaxID=75058 RepID=A0A0S4JP98_BODSA|nr:Hypothetical protein, putative [Bodo saltans]|eukprot:CUG93374.1 Hypothetical protein, putative [Bodo saltans]
MNPIRPPVTQTSGQRQTMTASDLAAASIKTIACHEHVLGFTHNPSMIGYTSTMLTTTSMSAKAEDATPSKAEPSKTQGNEDNGYVPTPANEIDRLMQWLDEPESL